MAGSAHRPRLYLAIPSDIDPASAGELSELLRSTEVAAVLLRMPQSEPRALLDRIKAFAPAVQAAGAALLIDGHADLVARGGADGAHLLGVDDLQEALPSLKPQRIVGVGSLTSRHDAMIAGEAGADYVTFGDSDPEGLRPSTEAIAERVAWWAEVFQVPCVAYATSLDECEEFAAAGADFVLLEHMIWNDARGAGAALMDVVAVMGHSRSSARPKVEADT